jgi:hypothetical protein
MHMDASAALELVIARLERLSIAALLQHFDWVVAPSLFAYEVAAFAGRRARR